MFQCSWVGPTIRPQSSIWKFYFKNFFETKATLKIPKSDSNCQNRKNCGHPGQILFGTTFLSFYIFCSVLFLSSLLFSFLFLCFFLFILFLLPLFFVFSILKLLWVPSATFYANFKIEHIGSIGNWLIVQFEFLNNKFLRNAWNWIEF